MKCKYQRKTSKRFELPGFTLRTEVFKQHDHRTRLMVNTPLQLSFFFKIRTDHSSVFCIRSRLHTGMFQLKYLPVTDDLLNTNLGNVAQLRIISCSQESPEHVRTQCSTTEWLIKY